MDGVHAEKKECHVGARLRTNKWVRERIRAKRAIYEGGNGT